MRTEVINKIIITAEAVFDYEESLGLGRLDKKTLKAEVEEYIDIKNRSGRLLYENYFRCEYLDEDSGQILMMFLYRTDKWGTMQNWIIKGICIASDCDEEFEDSGAVRVLLESAIEANKKGDWVLELQARKRLEARLLAETASENYGEDYIVMVKDLLNNYRINKAKVAVMPTDDPEAVGLSDKVGFLDLCIEQIATDEQALIKDIYINGMSLRLAGRKYGYSKTGLFKKKERIIAILETLFAERYEIH